MLDYSLILTKSHKYTGLLGHYCIIYRIKTKTCYVIPIIKGKVLLALIRHYEVYGGVEVCSSFFASTLDEGTPTLFHKQNKLHGP